jgi:hypothetical protein
MAGYVRGGIRVTDDSVLRSLRAASYRYILALVRGLIQVPDDISSSPILPFSLLSLCLVF